MTYGHPGPRRPPSRRAALLAVQDESPRIAGWQARLRTWPDCRAAFDEGMGHLGRLVEHVPEARHVIHGDLLNRNVLVDEAGVVTSVFDWGSSQYGDFLYDVAWLAFCVPWARGLRAEEVRRRAHGFFLRAGADVDD